MVKISLLTIQLFHSLQYENETRIPVSDNKKPDGSVFLPATTVKR